MGSFHKLVFPFLFLFALAGMNVSPASATPLNQWNVSCGADKGAITKKGGVWTFRTSTNHCPGGMFSQRAEISTKHVKPTIKGAYLFETHVAMTTGSTQKFDIFQIHDSRHGCAPPLKVDIRADGRIELISDVKTGPGESCIRGKLSNQVSRDRLRRDGTEQNLKILIEFDGKGGFKTTVWLDGVQQISGWYHPSDRSDAWRPEKFYFKHGVYSQHMFDYVLTSRDMKVRKVRLAN